MFNQLDLGGSVPESCSPVGSCDLIDASGNNSASGEIASNENDPAVRRGRQESQTNHRARQKPNAPNFDSPANGTLIAIG
jgi:hypothetical protein